MPVRDNTLTQNLGATLLRAIAEAEAHAAEVKKKANKKAFAAPRVQWIGFANDTGPALRNILAKTANNDPERDIRRLRMRIKEQEHMIDEYRDIIRRYKATMDEHKLTKQNLEREITELEAQLANPEPVIDDERLDELVAYLRKLHGVLAIKVMHDGSIKLLVRTAIRADDGKLYDMGDFELTLPSTGFARMGEHWSELSDTLNICLVRLPRKDYDKRDEYGYPVYGADLRLHHHLGTARRYADGTYYVEGGRFCSGNRSADIVRLLQSGEIEQGLSLMIGTLTDTQWKEELPRYGRFIPAEHEDDFYTTQLRDTEKD